MKHTTLAALLLLATVALASDSLPDAPGAVGHPESRQTVWTRPLLASVALHGAVRVGDDINTCRGLAQGAREAIYPTQSCGGVVAWNAATFGAFTFASYELAKHGHRKWALALQYIGAGSNAVGIATSRAK
jgi:hypothetical protein